MKARGIKKIAIAGHSLGAAMASYYLVANPDPAVKAVAITSGGPGLPHGRIGECGWVVQRVLLEHLFEEDVRSCANIGRHVIRAKCCRPKGGRRRDGNRSHVARCRRIGGRCQAKNIIGQRIGKKRCSGHFI